MGGVVLFTLRKQWEGRTVSLSRGRDFVTASISERIKVESSFTPLAAVLPNFVFYVRGDWQGFSDFFFFRHLSWKN